jgi:hypothetical protein
MSQSDRNLATGASQQSIPYVLPANGRELLQLKLFFSLIMVVAIYFYITIRFSPILLIIYAMVLALFFWYAHSIRLIVSHDGVSLKIGIARTQFLLMEEIDEITMGFHPYGLSNANLLVIHSINSSKENIRINYFLLFRRQELSRALKMILELNPNIRTNGKTVEFLSDAPYTPYERH